MQKIVEIEKNNFCQDSHDLHNAIAAINDIAKENLVDQSNIHDINIVAKDLLEYIKHLVCDVQQRKEKAHIFQNLNEETIFWLRDYCQKVIPVTFLWHFVKGRSSILGRKGCLFMLMSF